MKKLTLVISNEGLNELLTKLDMGEVQSLNIDEVHSSKPKRVGGSRRKKGKTTAIEKLAAQFGGNGNDKTVTRKELTKFLVANGYNATSLSPTLTELRRQNIVYPFGKGDENIIFKARAHA